MPIKAILNPEDYAFFVDMARLKSTNAIYDSKAFTYQVIENEGDD